MRKRNPVGHAELGDLEVFAVVVEERSFTAAARALGTSTGAVSKRIAKLEDHLGVRLLERTTRRVAPTGPGALFYEHTLRVLQALEDAERAVGHLATAPRGTLRVSAGALFGERHVAPLLPAFLAAHRGVRIELRVSDRFVNLLEEAVDVAVRVGRLEDSSLRARRLGEVRTLVVASPAYLEARGTPMHPGALLDHVCLRYSLVPTGREWRFAGPEGEISVPVSGRLASDHGGVLLAATEAGGGLALLPEFIVDRALEAGRVVEVLADHRAAAMPVHAVYPSGHHVLPAVRAFVDHLVEAMPARLAPGRGQP
ncbi:MAG: LysR family transcriptional regulator [Sandaracinaceae bacterium]